MTLGRKLSSFRLQYRLNPATTRDKQDSFTSERMFSFKKRVYSVYCSTILLVYINFISPGLYCRLDSFLLISEFTVSLNFRNMKELTKHRAEERKIEGNSVQFNQ